VGGAYRERAGDERRLHHQALRRRRRRRLRRRAELSVGDVQACGVCPPLVHLRHQPAQLMRCPCAACVGRGDPPVFSQ